MIERIVLQIRSLSAVHADIEVYIFGSALTREDPADLDLVVVYSDRKVLGDFLTDIYCSVGPIPIDVTAMTPVELVLSEFLKRSKAVPLNEFSLHVGVEQV